MDLENPIQSELNMSQLPNSSAQTATAVQQNEIPKELTGATAPMSLTRVQVTRLFLTYPQCQTPKETVEQNLKNFTKEFNVAVRFYVIAEEIHENGDPHLHLAVGFEDKMRLSSKTLHSALDKLVLSDRHPEGKHGNYQTIKSLSKVLAYVTKKGKFLIKGVELPKFNNNSQFSKELKRKEMEEVVELLVSGATPSQVMDQYTTFYFAQRKRITEFAQDVQLLKLSTKKLDKVVHIKTTETTMNISTSGLISWLNGNVLESNRKTRQPRQKQLWLHGPPRIGKSRMISTLSKFLRIYEIPTEDWYDQYKDDAYDLAILDEFTGQKPIWWLNRWLDGNMFHLKQRNQPGVNKMFNIPTIIVSNYHPDAIFTSTKVTGSLAGLLDRLEIVYVDDPFEIIVEIEKEKEKEENVIDLT
nr:rep protein [Cressdnaviricota sp.]